MNTIQATDTTDLPAVSLRSWFRRLVLALNRALESSADGATWL